MWLGVYYFLKEMGIFGYRSGVYVVLSFIISTVSIGMFNLGVIAGVIGAIIFAFSLKYSSILIKVLIVGGYIILTFVIIPMMF
jgi:hypothetical protein